MAISSIMSRDKKRWLLVLPLIGILALLILVKFKSAPEQVANRAVKPAVVVGIAKERMLAQHIVGYGRAQAKQIWRAISEVEGRVIYKHPDLEVGALLNAGTVVLKIDPADYELKLAQAKYDLSSAQARVDMIEFNQQKMTQSLRLESERLDILRQELKRKTNLLKKGSVSQSVVDQQQSQVFSQQQKVLELKTSIDLIPSDLAVVQANVLAQRARVEEAQLKLSKTIITLPQDSRITQVNIEQQQVVTARSILLEARYLGVMKVNAQFNHSQARALLSRVWQNQDSKADGFPDVRTLPLQATLIYYSGALDAGGKHSISTIQWPAKVTRITQGGEALSNSLQMALETHNQWLNFDPIKQPPLLEDMFVEVKIGSGVKAYLSVPLSALRSGHVFVVENGVLRKKPVEVLFTTQQYAAINGQLAGTVQSDEQVLISDILPTLEGMQVSVVEELP
ncbi:efflux RND transporter periplasmic adaptor subunit [Pseudoalteromonas byunsanensis]|uniref:HlyD family secretion protein n=1 Tax=Pseudoalteromonas byunsanensis TaxID=327939 RepID=A0A1S1N565_9GAMM|nr:hypothetical protein [Pseudoalteromonas byunsanensis]OHU93403.1 hypothetical protein BIW53_18755 [Pseudoalteromonas byunsanensis]